MSALNLKLLLQELNSKPAVEEVLASVRIPVSMKATSLEEMTTLIGLVNAESQTSPEVVWVLNDMESTVNPMELHRDLSRRKSIVVISEEDFV